MIRITTSAAALLAVVLASFLFAQDVAFDGTWYGVIDAPGARFDIAVSLQSAGRERTGVLLLENGATLALTSIDVREKTISFSADSGNRHVTFHGTMSNDGAEISGEFVQDGATYPFKLSRKPEGPLQGASLAIDPGELLSMMTSFSGPPGGRPFVPPVTYPAIGYGVRPPHDPVSKLMHDVENSSARLRFDGEDGYLRSVLDVLNVPLESQMAVFSKNSLQTALIGPGNPRRIYFNDSVAVAAVRGGFIELAAQDPELGVNFYLLPQRPSEKPSFMRRDDCLQCHLSRSSLDVPGMLMRSVFPARDGTPVNSLGFYLLDHRTEFEQRWGGWFVTGAGPSMHSLGNSAVSDPADAKSLSPITYDGSSDVVALMVFEHQMHMMNLITRTGWEFRVASSLQRATGRRTDVIDRQLRDDVADLVDYLLFINEARLPGPIESPSPFAEKFAAQGPRDARGRSLRDLDLRRRLFRYPCSYMIYSPAFDGMPAEAKRAVYQRMKQVMASRMSRSDRDAVTEILKDTKKDF